MDLTETRGRDKSITSPPERVPYRRGRRPEGRPQGIAPTKVRRASFQQMATLRKTYMAQKPWWRRPLVGYLLSIPLVALCPVGSPWLGSWASSVLRPAEHAGSRLFLYSCMGILAFHLGWPGTISAFYHFRDDRCHHHRSA